MFFDTATFGFLTELKCHWLVVRDELDAADDTEFRSWRERHIYNRDWRTLVLFDGYEQRTTRRIEETCGKFPATTRYLEAIPGLLSAGFSRLGPGALIRPHRGCDPCVLRVHLGLHVPKGSGISVRGQVRRWEEGELLAFDDTYLHEAWNLGARPRTILLLDISLGARPEELLGDAIEPLRTRDVARWAYQWARFSFNRLGRSSWHWRQRFTYRRKSTPSTSPVAANANSMNEPP